MPALLPKNTKPDQRHFSKVALFREMAGFFLICFILLVALFANTALAVVHFFHWSRIEQEIAASTQKLEFSNIVLPKIK